MPDQVDGLLSNFLRKKRIESVLPHIRGRVCDMGCGVGKLAEYLQSEDYAGIDKDADSIRIALSRYPNYKFYTLEETLSLQGKFDSVVALAVIEHVKNPLEFILYLKSLLAKGGLIVITTPHPCTRLIHNIGSKMGLFSSHAEEEHEKLIDKCDMVRIAHRAQLNLVKSKRFLFGMNQLFILSED